MGGETDQNVSGWTTDTLKAHVDRQFALLDQLRAEADKRYEQRFQSQEKAIDKSDTATDKRFEGVNEFRQTLSDQTARFLTRDEYDRAHLDLIAKVEQSVKTLEQQLRQLGDRVTAVGA